MHNEVAFSELTATVQAISGPSAYHLPPPQFSKFTVLQASPTQTPISLFSCLPKEIPPPSSSPPRIDLQKGQLCLEDQHHQGGQ